MIFPLSPYVIRCEYSINIYLAAIMTRLIIIVSNINKHLAFESILADCQHGFRSQRSCETKLVQFFHDLVSNLDRALNRNHRQTDVIIMDFAKAFDTVPNRRRLLRDKRIYS